MIGEDFYVRGDGTVSTFYYLGSGGWLQEQHPYLTVHYMHQCSFYFSEDFLSTLLLGAGFNTLNINTYCRQIHNRSHKITMSRYGEFFHLNSYSAFIFHSSMARHMPKTFSKSSLIVLWMWPLKALTISLPKKENKMKFHIIRFHAYFLLSLIAASLLQTVIIGVGYVLYLKALISPIQLIAEVWCSCFSNVSPTISWPICQPGLQVN